MQKNVEAKLLSVSIDKAKSELGWRPQLTIREALKWTSEWYIEFYKSAPESMLNYSLEQIREFQSLIIDP